MSKHELPKGILASDLVCPTWKQRAYDPEGRHSLSFELWYSESFGWCIPTLLISRSRRVSQSYSGGERTYAVSVKTGGTVRIGNGPHIKERHVVYVKKTRLAKLQKFLDLQGQGAERANTIRDNISTRRARTAARRSFWL